MCLSSSTRSHGVIFIDSSSYYVYNPMKIDISKDLVYTKLITNNRGFLLSEEYYFQVSSIRIAGQEVPLNKTLLSINKNNGVGGTKISSTIPFTILHTSIYDAVKIAFIKALPKNVTLVEPPMKRFGVCFSSKDIRRTKVGPYLPVIDFVLQKQNAFWRIYGANSAVQVKKDVLYLAFVGRDQTWEPSIVIGGHQLEENLLVFDLPKKKIGFSSPLKLQQASCSNSNSSRPSPNQNVLRSSSSSVLAKNFLPPAPSSASTPVPKFRKDSRDRAPGSKSQGSVNNGHTNPLCWKCGINHQGKFKASSDVCFGCGKLGHRIRESPIVVQRDKNDRQQGQTNSSAVPAGCPTQQSPTSIEANGQHHSRMYTLQAQYD
ncbi:hypothetical protein CQW23_01837 [Capsicum baccatum]|uniref:Xylanase inhibitor C-terminal domain-containing protein n=1 Tax=Capsicum baccatum TaxID=33114 RepID=A0A2G2XPR1_CAPBA|nr:hypothetical protein CQW23_01837 [Capsicum baccatum]